MESKFIKKITINTNTTYDFIVSIFTLVNQEEEKRILPEYGLQRDTEIEKWINETYDKLDNEYLKRLEFYFAKETLFGLDLLKFIHDLELEIGKVDIPTFLERFSNIGAAELLSYLFLSFYDSEEELSKEIVKKWLKKGNFYQLIKDNFKVGNRGKWAIMEILNNPIECKKELLGLFKNFYRDYYRKEEARVTGFLNRYSEENKDEIKEGVSKGIDYFFSPESDLIDLNQEIKTVVTYFGGKSSVFFSDNLQVLGYKYFQYINKITAEQQGIEEHSDIFKVIGDQTRLKILLELNKGPKYMTELGNKLGISIPTVDYHVKRFINVGLVQIDKAENRVYYKLRKDRLRNAIKLLEDSFNL